MHVWGECLTFVLQCVVCGLQHGLVEVLSKGLRCEPLQGPIPSILHGTGLLFLGRSNNIVLEALELPVWLSLHELSLFMMKGQGWRDAGHVGVHGGFERVVMEEMLRFVRVGRGGAGRVWVQMSI